LTLANNLNCPAGPTTTTVDPAIAAAAVAQALGLTNPSSIAAVAAAVASNSHNLIPAHLQSTAAFQEQVPSWLHGTPGHQPALIAPPRPKLHPASNNPNNSVVMDAAVVAQHVQQQQQQAAQAQQLVAQQQHQQLLLSALQQQQQQQQSHTATVPRQVGVTVQDLPPTTTPIYNGVNPSYPGLRVVNNSPPMFAVDNFLTPPECAFLVASAQDSLGPAPVVGKGSGEISPSRTSSTCYLAREDLPDLMRKVSCLTGKPVEHCELPQVGRYLPSQQYLQHFDAFDLGTEDGLRFASNGGQRTVTCLIYLNDVPRGGATNFPALNIQVQPRQGTCLVFFPATIDGHLDKLALHAAMPAVDTKFVSQVWIRQSNYNGQPSKRLPQTMGVPFGQEHQYRLQQSNPLAAATATATTTTTGITANSQQQQF